MIPPGNTAQIRGTMTEPTGSMCFIGFKVSLPAYFAVGSPCQSAARPWATSWTTTDITNIRMEKRAVMGFAFRKQYDSMLEHMAKVCAITKRGSLRGGGYSNETRAEKFNPTGMTRKYVNLQKKRVYIPELKKTMVLTISTKAIKTIQKNGAFATLKKAGLI